MKKILLFFDMMGKQAYTTESRKEQGFFKKELQLSNLSAGAHMVVLTVDGHSETRKKYFKIDDAKISAIK